MYGVFWWIRQVILVLVGCFFLFFGIDILIAAYKLKDPSFIMMFFASNLIILISATLVLGFIIRMVRVYKQSKNCEENEADL